MTPWLGPVEQEALMKIDRKAEAPLSDLVGRFLPDCPDPAMALANLDRWLGAVSSPSIAAQQILSFPATGQLLLKVLGSSSELGSCLIQNPELASLILDPTEVGRPLSKEGLIHTGRRLLEAAHSYAHRLDRLRFLKQEVLVRIAAADQARLWGPEECWTALSILADALILLARDAAWHDFALGRSLPEDCPLHIAGMGKLGGQELNYSSDIDLVYFVDDEADDDLLRQATRFAEKLNRAFADRMGRGSLYRVDMRLRPYGRSGHLVTRQRALESYMDRHAETWEHMALIRSRVVAGSHAASDRWDKMRTETCFSHPHGDWRIEEILHMRKRIEERSSDRDLKRGPGGIRDVEFTVQILQLLHGSTHPELRTAGTLQALHELERLGFLPKEAEEDLRQGCLFLRAVEHQVQVEAGRQTHETPDDPEKRSKLARRLGCSSLREFDLLLDIHRTKIRHWHESVLGVKETHASRETVLSRSGAHAAAVAAWMDPLPGSESLYGSLAENESSLERVHAVLRRAPALSPWLRASDSVTEQIMSGEILEDPSPPTPPLTASRLRTRWLRSACRTALGLDEAFPREQGQTWEALLASMAPPGLAVAALGSFAEGELSLESDLDLVFLAGEDREKEAIAFSQALASLKVQGSPLSIDLRLRPEGRQGPVAVTLPYFRTYAATRLEPWERVAASRARLVCGPAELFQEFMALAVGEGLSKEARIEALRIKRRVEHERAVSRRGWWDIKLGPGGLDDVIWALHLLCLAHPEAFPPVPGQQRTLPAAAQALASAGLISPAEAELLASHSRSLFRARRSLALAGLHDSLLPLEDAKLKELGVAPALTEGRQAAREVTEEMMRRAL